jgi:hypothetical protein
MQVGRPSSGREALAPAAHRQLGHELFFKFHPVRHVPTSQKMNGKNSTRHVRRWTWLVFAFMALSDWAMLEAA